ncbi:type III-B CRISPR module RAMP protein Cmr1 [Candidatus Methanodesulfokora washburnensis]|uniref:Type III-B CRISPR module RAMP protein Cmr1 n=1 Tax=Candidatus Methanodesulfokora washburnensis TaxID=2478471 RepID=A0A3R9R8Q5_9CREN|nr:type III-B CRISPR module RAMP protein Cmr1 [Candidatus Methanodesulfokores washburnensis]RSN77462.1 type III-B CRISPR module RAMP protein Cmr1 [Candidatus Methanodesulfokores washburnensis]
MSLILKLRSENWLLLGGYDTQFHKDDPLRTQSIKGLWRYWLRVYIAGALYEAGKLKCKKECTSEIEYICEKTGNILGSLNSASKFRIIVNKVSFSEKGHKDICSAQRIKLLSLGGRWKVSYGENLYAEIRIEESPHVKRIDENERKLALGSLLTALSLNGIGKGGRRGLGTFSIEVDGFEGKFLKDKKINYNMLKELINGTLDSARSYLNLEVERVSEIPPLDCISRVKIDLSDIGESISLFDKREVPVFTIIKVEPKTEKRIEDMVIELQDFFYRPGRLRRMGFKTTSADKSQDIITRRRLAWFLGLPREQRGTGYISNVNRRASPIHLAVHEENALFTLFLSSNWPTEIRWKGLYEKEQRGEKPLNVDGNRVKEAYLCLISSLENYLKKMNYKYEVIYP